MRFPFSAVITDTVSTRGKENTCEQVRLVELNRSSEKKAFQSKARNPRPRSYAMMHCAGGGWAYFLAAPPPSTHHLWTEWQGAGR